MQRVVEPEILDELPEDDPAALHNRRDLTILNRLMGNYRWFARAIADFELISKADELLEFGAGQGELGLHLKRKFSGRRLPPYTALDFCSPPTGWPSSWRWIQQDLLEYPNTPKPLGVMGNLILHQFSDQALATLGKRLDEDAQWLLFCEPARRKMHLHQLRLGAVLNFGEVTWHDAPVSIRAGFINFELPKLLQLDSSRWEWRCSTTFLGAYRMIAWRK